MPPPPNNFWNIVASAHRGAIGRRLGGGMVGNGMNPAPILQQTVPSVPVSSAVASSSVAPSAPAPVRQTPRNGGRHHPPKTAPKGYKRKPTVSFEVGEMLDMQDEAFAAQMSTIQNARRMRGRGVKSGDVNVLARPGALASTVGAPAAPSVAEITGQPDLVGQNPLEPDRRTMEAEELSRATTSRAAVAPATVATPFGADGVSVSIPQSRGVPGVIPASVDGEKQVERSSLFRGRR